ncbi:PfaD family polyunsaturated fatty acid/polyketide biosynthesis protein [Streptomyces albidoflavus]
MLGSEHFRRAHGVRYSYMAGAMAGGISSVELVATLANAGFLASFGCGGLPIARTAQALARLEREVGDLGYAVNLLHTPNVPATERAVVDLCSARKVRCLEASAFMGLTPPLVRYRVAGLSRDAAGRVVATNRVIAKVSRAEVARHFLLPAPEAMVGELVAEGAVTEDQAELARMVPMADDLTVEADSGGHTDRRPLMIMLPVVRELRDSLRRERPWLPEVRLGAAGGIGTPDAILSALALGADYVVTGSINQSCVEAGTSEQVRQMLAAASPTDVDMAPSGAMFEYGAEVQVLKRETMFASRARRLYKLYRAYGGLDELPPKDFRWLESQVLGRSVSEVWADVVTFFERTNPVVLERAAVEPKKRMALVFRWYLGLSSRWALSGHTERSADYQVWCGPSMGGFNEWVQGSHLAAPENRAVADVARQLLLGTAYGARVGQLRLQGADIPSGAARYRPVPSA